MTKEEFAQVVFASTDSLYRISKSILRNDADCEDAVQEAITIAFEKLYTLRKDCYAKTWLVRIVMNECYKIARRKEREYATEQSDMLEKQEQSETTGLKLEQSDVYQALLALEERQRVVLVLFYVEEYSLKEIARITNVPVGTVKSRLSRGRKQLRKWFEEEFVYE